MKKTISVITVLALTSVLFAQNKKGNWLVGVNVGAAGASFGNSESNSTLSPNISKSDNHSFNINVAPTAGYYFSDNVVIGASVGLYYYSGKNDNSNTGSAFTSESKSHNFYVGLSPFGRIYFGGNSNGSPFAEINPGVSFYPGYKGTYRPSTGNGYEYSYDKYTAWNGGVKIGYEHFINPVIGIEYYIGYNYSHYNYDVFYNFDTGTDYTTTYKSNSSNINFGAGLMIHLECNKKKK